jgi:hypothetical protein
VRKNQYLMCCGIILIASTLSIQSSADFGEPDQWWLLYKKNNGKLVLKKGPYKTKYECEVATHSLPLDTIFIECVQ